MEIHIVLPYLSVGGWVLLGLGTVLCLSGIGLLIHAFTYRETGAFDIYAILPFVGGIISLLLGIIAFLIVF
jgi:uncharacterized membrane protein HdeD (DUF308 family)